MKIGKTELRHGLMLAPMAGFSDSAMREVCHMHGAEYSVTEMISAKAVVYGDRKTFSLAKIGDREGPVSLQIFGSEPSIMAEGASILEDPPAGVSPVAIDINMGCPVHKIFSNGEGSALMRSPELIFDIVKAVSRAVSIPCTVKMRLGIDSEHINLLECAAAAEEGGAALIAVHGRTRAQIYSGKADMSEIKRLKEKAKIPIVANGDIESAADALRVLSESGADGIMIGRGAVGNPFVFEEIIAAKEGKSYTPPTFRERLDTAKLQLSLAIADKGEDVAVREARKQIALYFHGFRGVAALRAEINRAETFEDVLSALEKFENE